MLAGLARLEIGGLVFFGGTALSLTHLPNGRLSEDVDLYVPARAQVARVVDKELPRMLRREYPRSQWDPALSAVRATAAARLVTEEGLAIRVQLLDADAQGWRWLPTEVRALEQRYGDVPVTSIAVPTRAAFVAMKAAAWVDRRAARDLFDLPTSLSGRRSTGRPSSPTRPATSRPPRTVSRWCKPRCADTPDQARSARSALAWIASRTYCAKPGAMWSYVFVNRASATYMSPRPRWTSYEHS